MWLWEESTRQYFALNFKSAMVTGEVNTPPFVSKSKKEVWL